MLVRGCHATPYGCSWWAAIISGCLGLLKVRAEHSHLPWQGATAMITAGRLSL